MSNISTLFFTFDNTELSNCALFTLEELIAADHMDIQKVLGNWDDVEKTPSEESLSVVFDYARQVTH